LHRPTVVVAAAAACTAAAAAAAWDSVRNASQGWKPLRCNSARLKCAAASSVSPAARVGYLGFRV